MSWSEVVARYDELVETHHHVDLYWFPHTDTCLVKLNDRSADEPEPLPRWRATLEDELLSNTLFDLVNRVTNRRPGWAPRLNHVITRALSERCYSDVSHRVFVSPRSVVFREMEYSLPREVGIDTLVEARRLIERSGWQITFPVEVRCTPADDAWLSTSSGRESVYLAFHVHRDMDHRAYFEGVEPLLRERRGPSPLGQAAHPQRRRPGAGLPPLRGLPRRARPARPRAAVHQPLPRPRPGLTPPSCWAVCCRRDPAGALSRLVTRSRLSPTVPVWRSRWKASFGPETSRRGSGRVRPPRTSPPRRRPRWTASWASPPRCSPSAPTRPSSPSAPRCGDGPSPAPAARPATSAGRSTAHLETIDVDPESVEWDSWRREDGRWTVTASYLERGDERAGPLRLRRRRSLRRGRGRRGPHPGR